MGTKLGREKIEINMVVGYLSMLKKRLLCHRLIEYERQTIERTCSELIIVKQKRICFSIYRPSEYSSLTRFLMKLPLP